MELEGSLIHQLRINKGWTQSDLARETGQSLKTIQNHEKGGKIPRSKQGLYLRVFKEELEGSPVDEKGDYSPNSVTLDGGTVYNLRSMAKLVEFLSTYHPQLMVQPLYSLYIQRVIKEAENEEKKELISELLDQLNNSRIKN